MIQISVLVPTRARSARLRAFLESLADNAEKPREIEVVLLIDDDDREMTEFISDNRLNVVKVAAPAGLTMGEMNRRCFAASSGRWVMLANDDIVVRTKGWDREILSHAQVLDGIGLIHVNDGLFGRRLCTFPCVSRRFAEIIGEICPDEYLRYRIDDHIFHIFCLLAYLGHKRITYLPGVLFEHQNFSSSAGGRWYEPNPDFLEKDAAVFEKLGERRHAAVLALLRELRPRMTSAEEGRLARKIKRAPHAFQLRRDRFLRVVGKDLSRPSLLGRVARRLAKYLQSPETTV